MRPTSLVSEILPHARFFLICQDACRLAATLEDLPPGDHRPRTEVPGRLRHRPGESVLVSQKNNQPEKTKLRRYILHNLFCRTITVASFFVSIRSRKLSFCECFCPALHECAQWETWKTRFYHAFQFHNSCEGGMLPPYQPHRGRGLLKSDRHLRQRGTGIFTIPTCFPSYWTIIFPPGARGPLPRSDRLVRPAHQAPGPAGAPARQALLRPGVGGAVSRISLDLDLRRLFGNFQSNVPIFQQNFRDRRSKPLHQGRHGGRERLLNIFLPIQ